ncbi:MAG TPA: malectin domain-containing carbohydrate-binding protein, partial [Candidatus Nitrosopolaris sp.]|nr:malectin domain-containing carbohydrate-binding protein [Candidatus Nitrosopolaris sp.]
MRLKIFCLIVALGGWFAPSPIFGNDEVCVACDKTVRISGEFSHQRAWGVTTIEGATWRGGEAFREEIYGTNFNLSVSGLPAGKYDVVIGLVEVDFTNAGQRVFDITCGDRLLASKLDIFTAAGGAGKVLLLTNQVDHADDALHGPLTFAFTGRIGPAKLNSFELKDDSGQS